MMNFFVSILTHIVAPVALVSVLIATPLTYIHNKPIANSNVIQHIIYLASKRNKPEDIKKLYKYFKSNSIYFLSGRSNEEVLGAIERLYKNVQRLTSLVHGSHWFIDSGVKECLNLVHIYLSEQEKNPFLKFDKSFAESETAFSKNLSHRFHVCNKWDQKDFDFALETCKNFFENLGFLNLQYNP